MILLTLKGIQENFFVDKKNKMATLQLIKVDSPGLRRATPRSL